MSRKNSQKSVYEKLTKKYVCCKTQWQLPLFKTTYLTWNGKCVAETASIARPGKGTSELARDGIFHLHIRKNTKKEAQVGIGAIHTGAMKTVVLPIRLRGVFRDEIEAAGSSSPRESSLQVWSKWSSGWRDWTRVRRTDDPNVFFICISAKKYKKYEKKTLWRSASDVKPSNKRKTETESWNANG